MHKPNCCWTHDHASRFCHRNLQPVLPKIVYSIDHYRPKQHPYIKQDKIYRIIYIIWISEGFARIHVLGPPEVSQCSLGAALEVAQWLRGDPCERRRDVNRVKGKAFQLLKVNPEDPRVYYVPQQLCMLMLTCLHNVVHGGQEAE